MSVRHGHNTALLPLNCRPDNYGSSKNVGLLKKFGAPYCAAAIVFLNFGLLEIRLSSRDLFLMPSSLSGRTTFQFPPRGYLFPHKTKSARASPRLHEGNAGSSCLFSWDFALLVLLFLEKGERAKQWYIVVPLPPISASAFALRPMKKSRFKNIWIRVHWCGRWARWIDCEASKMISPKRRGDTLRPKPRYVPREREISN